MVHELKITPEYYAVSKEMAKLFEVRKNDRDYQVGDVLALNEWQGGKYTGKAVLREITYILDDPEYCKEGYVILGVKPFIQIDPFRNFIVEELTRG